MWLLSCFMLSSKQAIKGQKHPMGISHQILSSLTSVDILHNIIKYLPQESELISSSNSLETQLFHLIYYRPIPYTWFFPEPTKMVRWNITIHIWCRSILSIPITNTYLCHYHTPSSKYFIPQFTTGSQILNKGAITNKGTRMTERMKYWKWQRGQREGRNQKK